MSFYTLILSLCEKDMQQKHIVDLIIFYNFGMKLFSIGFVVLLDIDVNRFFCVKTQTQPMQWGTFEIEWAIVGDDSNFR